MGEEFYAIIKLISGEEIFSLVSIDENEGDPVIVLQNPVIIKYAQSPIGESYIKVKPWVELSDDDFFIIKLDKIITMTESNNKKLIEIYTRYLQDDSSDDLYMPNNLSGKVKVTKKMGYISSVEDARKKLENLFKDLKEG